MEADDEHTVCESGKFMIRQFGKGLMPNHKIAGLYEKRGQTGGTTSLSNNLFRQQQVQFLNTSLPPLRWALIAAGGGAL